MFCLSASEFEDAFLSAHNSPVYTEDNFLLDTQSCTHLPLEEDSDVRHFGDESLNKHTYETICCESERSSGELMHQLVVFDKQADWLAHTSTDHIEQSIMLVRRCSITSSQTSPSFTSSTTSSISDAYLSYTSATCAFHDKDEPRSGSASHNPVAMEGDERDQISAKDFSMPLEYATDEDADTNAISSPILNNPTRLSLSRSISALSDSSCMSLPLSIVSSPWNCLQEAHHPLCTGDCDVETRSTLPICDSSPRSTTSSWYSSSCPSPTSFASQSITGGDSNRSSMISTDCSIASSNEAKRYSWLNRPPELIRCTGRKRAPHCTDGRLSKLNIDGKHARVVSEDGMIGGTELWLEYWRVYEER